MEHIHTAKVEQAREKALVHQAEARRAKARVKRAQREDASAEVIANLKSKVEKLSVVQKQDNKFKKKKTVAKKATAAGVTSWAAAYSAVKSS